MNPAILFGLIAAACYGGANFVGRIAGCALGVTATLFWSQWCLFACASIAAVSLGLRLNANLSDWGLIAASNLSIIVATACLYRGLAVGRLSVVAPVMASYGAVGGALSLTTGEQPTPMLVAGLVLTIAGAVLSAIPSKSKDGRRSSGVWLAVGSALFYGLGYWLQGRFALPAFGPMTTVWLYYLSSALTFSVVALVTRSRLDSFESPKDVGILLTTAGLSGGGFAAMMLAQADGEIAVATALSSAATAITVILSFLFLKDKPDWKGWLGVAAVVAGVSILQMTSS